MFDILLPLREAVASLLVNAPGSPPLGNSERMIFLFVDSREQSSLGECEIYLWWFERVIASWRDSPLVRISCFPERLERRLTFPLAESIFFAVVTKRTYWIVKGRLWLMWVIVFDVRYHHPKFFPDVLLHLVYVS